MLAIDDKQLNDYLTRQVYGQVEPSDGDVIKERLKRIKAMPVPVASLVGERLVAVAVNSHGGSHRQTFECQVHGIDSGKHYFTTTVWLENADGELIPDNDELPRVYAATLMTCLHHPQDIDETIWGIYEAATGAKVGCAHCDELFTSYKDAVEHEAAVHDDPGDPRPRIGQLTGEHLASLGIEM